MLNGPEKSRPASDMSDARNGRPNRLKIGVLMRRILLSVRAFVTRRCRADREQLIIDLNELRRKEQATGLKLDAEKQAIKEKLKRAA